jgi:hypothetical protein
VDELAAVAIVSDRLRLRACMAELACDTQDQVAMPHAICAHDEVHLRKLLGQCVDGDAWLVKPAVACGVHESHDMRLVFNDGHLTAAVRSRHLK